MIAFAVVGGCGRTEASAAPSEKPAEKEPAPGPAAKGDSWSAEAKVTHAKKGDLWTFDVVLHATGGYHVNLEYPYKFLFDKTETLTFDKESIVKDDKSFTLENCKKTDKGDECTELHLVVAFKPKDAAAIEKSSVSGTLRFGVCSADKCKMDKAKLAVALTAAKNV